MYRINLSLTTSVVNANGGHLHTSYSDHLHFIVNELDKIGNFNDLNRVMKEKICELLETVDTCNTDTTDKVSNVSRDLAIAAGNSSVQEVNSTSKPPELCFVCEKYCADNAVLCDRCNSWSHYECENILESERQLLRYFYQLYTIHEGKNGIYIPLVFGILPAKTEICYQKMWILITDHCAQKNLVLVPKTIHIDFEKAMHKAISSIFSMTSIICCRFHLGQTFWRKIQSRCFV